MMPAVASTLRRLGRPPAGWPEVLGVFCLVAAVRWTLIAAFGVDMPWMDQWNGEGTDVVVPVLQGSLTAADLFKPHNEHRIVLTRALCAVLFLLDGTWSPLLEAYAAALIPATAAAVTVACCRAVYGPRLVPLAACGAVLCFGLPQSAQNLLFGFQSQMEFLVLFSLPALCLAADHRWSRANVLGGLGLSAGAALSMSSGVFTFAVLAGIWSLRAWADRRRRLRWGLAAAGAALLAGLALELLVAPVPGHAALRATGPRDFAVAAVRYLSWPAGFGLFLVWNPALLVGLTGVLTGKSSTRRFVFPFAVLAWVGLVIASAALLRGVGGMGPADRYHDLLAPALLAALCLPATLGPIRAGFGSRVAAGYQGAILAALVCSGLAGLGGLRAEHDRLAACAATLNAAQRSGADAERLILAAEPAVSLPFIEPKLVLWFLRHEQAGRLLPADIRPHLLPPARDAAAVPQAYPAVPDPPSGVEIGTFRGSDAWQGVVDTDPIPVPTGCLKLLVAGYLRPGELELVVEELPSHRRRSVSAAVPLGQGEQWREVFFDPGPGTQALRLSLVDRSAAPGGWFAVGGLQHAGRFERCRPWLGPIAGTCLLFGTLPLFMGLARLAPARR